MIHAFNSSDFRRNDSLSPEKLTRIKDLLLALHGMFEGEGKGLTADHLDTEEYKVCLRGSILAINMP